MELHQTWNERILKALKDIGRPALAKEICHAIKNNDDLQMNSFRVVLYLAVTDKIIYKEKFEKMPSFYFHPHWVDSDGKMLDKYEFKPRLKEFYEKTTDPELKD
jgi:hypothetical protein